MHQDRDNNDNSSISEWHSGARIMVFNPVSVDGHHHDYILYLVKYWCEKCLPGQLDLVVSQLFIDKHPDIVNLPKDHNRNNVRFVQIHLDEKVKLEGAERSLVMHAFKEFKLASKYARALKANHCLLLNIDHSLLPLALRLNPGCNISGIYFSPTFHYKTFAGYASTLRDSVRAFRKKVLLAAAMRNPSLRVLFSLDPTAVEHIKRFRSKGEVVHLPDPVQIWESALLPVRQLRERLGINLDKRVFLLFGVLNSRKGVYQLLSAMKLLPPSVCERICLIIQGTAIPSEYVKIESQVGKLRNSLPLQIIIRNEFIPESEVQTYFCLADVVLAPYQRHVGMSGALVRAAAAGKPLLASDYGLMGEIIRRRSLGLTVDSSLPDQIARGVVKFAEYDPQQMFDQAEARRFADENSSERYPNILFKQIFSSLERE